jgi:CRISPR-associated exonuclease Cas4
VVVAILITVIVLLLLLVAAINIVRAPQSGRPAVRERAHGDPRALGLPAGRIVYSDADGTARPLVARRYPLTGKPDYLVLTSGGQRVPVEIKSGRASRVKGGARQPRHEDVLQLVTYLIILDDLDDMPPRYGLLRYADATFEVPYAADLREEVLALLAEMEALDEELNETEEAPHGDPSLQKCRACAFKEICDDAMT